MVLDTDILFVSFYISQENNIFGGVALKKQFDEYLELQTSGFLLERLSFASEINKS